MHKGVVFCIRYLYDATEKTRVIISGGSDLLIHIIDANNMTISTTVAVEAIPISVDYFKYLLVGMKNGNIVEFDL